MAGTHGHLVSCSSNTTTCSAKLDCGHRYTASLVTSTATCNSSTGPSLMFDSGINPELLSGCLIYHFKMYSNKTLFRINPSSWSRPAAPCLPDRVVADLDCNVNSLAVQWRGSVSETDTYAALAIGSDSTRAACNTTGTNCTIQSLRCGLTYSIVVVTSSVNCGSIEGSDYSLQSGSCVSFFTEVHEAHIIRKSSLDGAIVC